MKSGKMPYIIYADFESLKHASTNMLHIAEKIV